jgi:hypothetical protein
VQYILFPYALPLASAGVGGYIVHTIKAYRYSTIYREGRLTEDDAVRFFSQTMFTPAALIGSAALGLLFLQPAKFAFCNPRDQPYSIFQFLYRASCLQFAFFATIGLRSLGWEASTIFSFLLFSA